MKRWIAALLICLSASMMSMSRILCAKSRLKQSSNKQLCLNTPRNFGHTHFIRGYDKPPKFNKEIKPLKEIDEKSYIINGSSAHLIDPSRNTQSFFTTIHDIASINLKLIEQAQQSIHVALFSLTDPRLADALLLAHKKGIDVCIIVDAGKMKDRYSKVRNLTDNGVPVWYYDYSLRPDYKKREWADPLMHHKCMIIDGSENDTRQGIVVAGSANGTKASQIDNIENINILRDPLAVQEHCQEFIRLKKLCVKCEKQEKTTSQKKNQ